MTPTPYRRPARLRRALVTAAAAAAMSLSGIVAVAAPAQAAVPTLTADKTTNLVYTGDTVTVSGTGFTPGINLNLTVCDKNDDPPAGCDMDSAFVRQDLVGSGGTFTVTLPVRSNDEIRDCRDAAVDCNIAVSNATVHTDRSQDAFLPITFAAEVAPQPTLSLSKSAVNVGDTITVTGTKFPAANADLTLRICAAAGSPCDTANAKTVTYTGSGTFTTDYEIKALTFQAVDCAPAACIISVTKASGGGTTHDAKAAITVAVVPAGDPTITLSKSVVKVGDTVTLTGKNFPNAAKKLWVSICADPPSATNCDTELAHVAQVDYNGSGGFTAQFTVKALAFARPDAVDCTKMQCVIGTSNALVPSDRSYNAAAKITVVPAGPQLAISKSKLRVGDTVTLTGTQFPKTAKSLYVSICADPPSATNCDMTLANIGQIAYNGSGGFTSTFKLKTSKFTAGDGVIDCTKVQCVIGTTNAVQPKDHSYNATAKFTVDTSAPAAKAPTKAGKVKVVVKKKGKKRIAVVTWAKAKANGTPVTGYTVQVKQGKKAFKKAGDTSASKTKLRWSKAKAGSSYKFRVVAKSKAGNSTSKAVKVTIKK